MLQKLGRGGAGFVLEAFGHLKQGHHGIEVMIRLQPFCSGLVLRCFRSSATPVADPSPREVLGELAGIARLRVVLLKTDELRAGQGRPPLVGFCSELGPGFRDLYQCGATSRQLRQPLARGSDQGVCPAKVILCPGGHRRRICLRKVRTCRLVIPM